MHGKLATLSASPVNRMLWFLNLWVYLNPIDLKKNCCRNELVNFHTIKENQPNRSITMTGNRSEICPRPGITLQASAPRVRCRGKRDAAGQWNSRHQIKIIEKATVIHHRRPYFMICLKTTFACTSVWLAFRLHLSVSCLIYWPVGASKPNKLLTKNMLSKRICKSSENTRNPTKSHHHHDEQSFRKLPSLRYYIAS